MEELYRIMFQAVESVQRECQLNALFDSLVSYVRRCTNNVLKQECGRLIKHVASTGVGSFDIRSRQVLWQYAVMAWADGWPIARGSAE